MTTWQANTTTVTWTAVDDPSVTWQVVVGGTFTGGGGGASELADLTDVDLTGLATNDVLAYNGTEWVPATLEDNAELLTAFEALLETVLGPEV
jgi:hypothetical protein